MRFQNRTGARRGADSVEQKTAVLLITHCGLLFDHAWCSAALCSPSHSPHTFPPKNAARCDGLCSVLHRPSQRAALPIAPPSVFRSIAERDSVEPLSENKAVQSVNRHKPSSARKEILSPPNTKPTAAMSISPNKTADCNAPTEASQSVIHSGALSSSRQPNS